MELRKRRHLLENTKEKAGPYLLGCNTMKAGVRGGKNAHQGAGPTVKNRKEKGKHLLSFLVLS